MKLPQNSWFFYLFSVVFLLVLYFIQKYLYLLDDKLTGVTNSEIKKRKPWPLLTSLGIGVFWYLYNTFSPNKISFNFKPENHTKWVLTVFLLFCFLGMIYESFSKFGKKKGVVRILIYTILMAIYFYAGVFTGLLIATVIAILLLFFVFKFFRRRLT